MPKRGFYRKSARHPEGAQKRALSEAGYTLLYTEGPNETVDDFVNSLRKNEVFGVTTVGRLASSREKLRDVLDRIWAKGAIVHEVVANRRSDDLKTMGLMVLDAANEIAADRRVHKHADAVAYGKKGGRPKTERMSKDEARKYWYDVKRYPKPEDALEMMTGYSRQMAYKHLGGRFGLPGIGRPRKPRSPK